VDFSIVPRCLTIRSEPVAHSRICLQLNPVQAVREETRLKRRSRNTMPPRMQLEPDVRLSACENVAPLQAGRFGEAYRLSEKGDRAIQLGNLDCLLRKRSALCTAIRPMKSAAPGAIQDQAANILDELFGQPILPNQKAHIDCAIERVQN